MSMQRLVSVATVGWLITGSAWGADCQALVKSFVNTANPSTSNLRVKMVSLNNRGVASYTDFSSLSYQPGIVGPGGTPRPGRFANTSGIDIPPIRQLFSDRATNQTQPFDVTKSDDLGIEITDGPSVTVTLTLKSWNNAKATFSPTCESGEFMLGKTPDVQYIFHLER